MRLPSTMTPAPSADWRSPRLFLTLMAVALPLGYATWNALLNNFAIEMAAFDGSDIGLLQSIREIPGFLAFTAVFLLAVVSEQRLALIAIALLGGAVAVTGLFATTTGLLITTFIMSVGFHYLETLKQSLSLQWLSKDEAPAVLGKLISVAALTSLLSYAVVWLLLEVLHASYTVVYATSGLACLSLMLFMTFAFPRFEAPSPQRKQLILRRRYGLYYALTFLAGARRQIFLVFASFLLVQRFGYSASAIAALYLINHGVSWIVAPMIGRWVGRFGERRILTVEYVGLIAVFLGYAIVDSGAVAATLFVIDHIFFAMAIAQKTYFQKIADPGDIAGTAGVNFTINHIAAVVIPASFGVIWLTAPEWVFILGAIMASASLLLALCVPDDPTQQRPIRLWWRRRLPAPAA